ncbi:hypothetical protein BP5796_06599 [Coleophoma crateriformis]|uniref:Major facilitator superfamily (MFS) profile domain-containing protein n=1 Tax=Coleophoma crateriformis TaxID=565419 RepID=A0A3D8RP99_9HELO|nr:hypothetical protein BP5796_06599 [Coleophoma crateriformis]
MSRSSTPTEDSGMPPLQSSRSEPTRPARTHHLHNLYTNVLAASDPPLRHLASNSTLRTQTSGKSNPSQTTSNRRTKHGVPFRPLSTTFEGQRHPGKPSLSITRNTKLWEPNDTSDIDELGSTVVDSRTITMSTIGREKPLLATPPELVEETEDLVEYPGSLVLGLLIAGICLSVFLISLDRTIITTAIPFITAEFSSTADIGWYGSGYLLTASAFQPLYGRIFMLFNIKWSFIMACLLFELGSLICGIAPNSLTLIIGRAVAGLGSAGILTGSFVVVAHSVPLKSRPVWTAVVGLMFGVGATVGPLLGGVFTDLVTWRWCFYFNLPVGGATIAAMVFFFHPAPSTKTYEQKQSFFYRVLELDLMGNVILLGAAVMLFLALEYTNQQIPWGSAKVIGLLVGSGFTFVVFGVWQWWKADGALMPPRILTQRTIAASCAVAFFIYSAILIQSYYLPIWFQAIKGDSAIHSGVNMIPYVVANAVFSLFAGIFVSKNGYFTGPAILGCAIGTIGCGLLSTLRVDSSSSAWIGFEFLTSAGIGMAIQQGFTAVQTVLPLDEIPIGTAAVVAFQSLGGAIFVSVGNTILQGQLLSAAGDKSLVGVDVQAVIAAGASAFRNHVSAEALPALLFVYNRALQRVFTASIPLCGLAFVSALFLQWKSVDKKGEEQNETMDEEAKIEAAPAAPLVAAEKMAEERYRKRSSTLSQYDTKQQIPHTLVE